MLHKAVTQEHVPRIAKQALDDAISFQAWISVGRTPKQIRDEFAQWYKSEGLRFLMGTDAEAEASAEVDELPTVQQVQQRKTQFGKQSPRPSMSITRRLANGSAWHNH